MTPFFELKPVRFFSLFPTNYFLFFSYIYIYTYIWSRDFFRFNVFSAALFAWAAEYTDCVFVEE